jgi:hypothetical protein
MGYYAVLKKIYRVVPEPLRLASLEQRYGLKRWTDPLRQILERYAPHDDIYNQAYYERTVGPMTRQSAPVMARSIRKEFGPTSVVDVGCGSGELLDALRAVGIPGAGFEYAEAGLAIARSRGLKVTKLDLEQPLESLPMSRADLAISTEVAEHLPERCADTFVGYLCKTANTVLITAAPPGQGGTDHVNEQPNEYWIAKFESRGFQYLRETSLRMRQEWEAGGVVDFYYRNLLGFRHS